MATVTLNSSGWSAGQLKITYTASNGTLTITEMQGKRSGGYRSWNTSDTSVTVTIGGTEKTVSLNHCVDFGNGEWNTWSAKDTSWTGLSGTSIGISVKMPSSGQAYGSAKFATSTADDNLAVMSWDTYTITYDANGGTGAPSSQTKTYGTSLDISSTVPKKTGYTFRHWESVRSDGTWYFQPSETTTFNGNQTLVAQWAENILTVNYYSNYATSAFDGALNSVGSDKNVLVHTGKIYYDDDYSTYGLLNYSNNAGSAYMTRIGYTATGDWGTSTSGGTLVNENDTFSTGQAIAVALGKDLSSGDASINIYAQWTENALTVNYCGNYADYGTFTGEVLPDEKLGKDGIAYTHKYYYDNAYSDGLYNIQNSEKLYLTRTGHTSTLHWGTSANGGTLIDQYTAFDTGQALAQALGKDLSNGNATINIYAQWRPNVLTMKYNVNRGAVDSDKYYIDNNLIGLISSSTVLEDKWNYNDGHENGLYNAKTFGLTREGYKFIGWAIDSSGETVFDQDDTTIVPTDLASNITTGDRTITLYAVWEISGVVYIDNGTTFEPYLAYIDNGSSWDLYIAYIDDGVNWNIIS